MNRTEAADILAILSTAYPNHYKNLNAKEAQGVISLWSTQFAELPADIVFMALNKHIGSSKFPPTIAEINEKITAIYWEAYGKAYPMYENEKVSAEEQQFFKRICRATEGYKYKQRIEPTIQQMLGGNNVKQLSEGK